MNEDIMCQFCHKFPAKHVYESRSGPMKLCGRCNPWCDDRKQKAAARVARGLRFEPLNTNASPHELKETTRVYFIQSVRGGPIKIGWAHYPTRRLAELQPGNPEPLHIIGLIRGGQIDESAIHRQFACLRLRGEWFSDDPSLLDFIAEHATSTARRAAS